ncbi:MAG TPA: LysR family transcriptional regulator [Herbaspirillum sp.]|uniref:LysR family transcriptional regulator n=1 Tax=Herbaspirillum sp. TaxID=1890675 RepID=UPI002D671AA9|nr:LysR family transcriptional regulator [Herbaspirillum sp.]HZG18464.1 LysR family transcriptional regulator [Herbaspirillum sp.]
MLQLDDMQLLRALGASASLAAAARLLDLTPPAVTVRLQRIEERIGVRVANRATRGFALTDEGQRLVQESVDILERIESLTARVSREADRGGLGSGVSGSLRVVAPFGFGRRYVAPLVRDLQRSHPQLAISLLLAESPLAAATGADAVISIGRVKGSSWIGHFLAPNERFLCAAPALARRMQRLKHPSELVDYPYVCLRENDDDVSRLRFTPVDGAGRRTGKALTVRLHGMLSSNDGTVTRDWALDGEGFVARSEWDCAHLLGDGHLKRVLPGWQLDPAPIMALLPSRQGLTTRQRLFLEAARRAFAPLPWRR